jgi:cell division protease FtsH
VFHSATSGAANDIEMATRIARAMVTQYGMSEEFGMMSLESVENRYLDGRPVLNCGEETAAQIDKVVQKMIKDAYNDAIKLLEENREILDRISDHLYEKETISGKEFMKIFREMKGLPEPEEETKEPKKGQVVDAQVSDVIYIGPSEENETKETEHQEAEHQESKETGSEDGV